MPPTTLDDAALMEIVVVSEIRGHRSFRCRLLELGLLPGAKVSKTKVAPLGDPVELEVRGRRLSVRRSEARQIHVRAEGTETVLPSAPGSQLGERTVS